MKKIVTLLLAAGLMLGGATASQAVDINMSGEFVFTGTWGQQGGNKYNTSSYNSTQNNSFYQRFRAQIDITASEALNGVVMFEIGDTVWGRSNTNAGRGAGGGIGADGVSVEVKRAYLDWIPPQTDLKIRMGIQGFATPSFVQNSSQVFDDDIAGITLNYQFTPNVATTVWWFRPYSDDTDNYNFNGNRISDRQFNEMDMFGLSIPLTFDGVKVTPWGMYAAIGRDAFNGYQGPTTATHQNALFPRWFNARTAVPLSSDGQGSGWWAGLTGEITAWNPFRLAFDFNYGSVDMGSIGNWDVKRDGWYAAILAEYKLDFMTPGLAFWYASGDDDDWNDGSGMMPTIKASSKLTSFGQDGAGFNTQNTALETGLSGTWGIMAQLKDISFVEDLKHTFRVAYYRGTNDADGVKRARNGSFGAAYAGFTPWTGSQINGGGSFLYMTDKDSAWEFNLDSSYEIYKNLSVGVELGYIRLDLSESTWGRAIENQSEDMYKIGIGLRYTF